MRRAAKKDDNQNDIVEVFGKTGWTVLDLSAVGDGCHDILIGRPGLAVLVEIKDGGKATSRRSLTKDQVTFHAWWTGPQDICCTVDEALRIGKFWHERAMGVHSRDVRPRLDELEVPRGTKS